MTDERLNSIRNKAHGISEPSGESAGASWASYRDFTNGDVQELVAYIDTLTAENAALRTRLELLREALKLYADPDEWTDDDGEWVKEIVWLKGMSEVHGYEPAKTALAAELQKGEKG